MSWSSPPTTPCWWPTPTLPPRSRASSPRCAAEPQRTAAARHRYRPWGNYRTVDAGERFQVKRITVKPGAKLSLQKHYHRAEHWVVVHGTAMVQRGEERMLVRENESVYIPIGTEHRLENPGKLPLQLIEVQSGPIWARTTSCAWPTATAAPDRAVEAPDWSHRSATAG